MHSIANFPERRPDQATVFSRSRVQPSGAIRGLLLKHALIGDGSRSAFFRPSAGSRAGPTATGPIPDCSRARTDMLQCNDRHLHSGHNLLNRLCGVRLPRLERGMRRRQLLRPAQGRPCSHLAGPSCFNPLDAVADLEFAQVVAGFFGCLLAHSARASDLTWFSTPNQLYSSLRPR